VGRYFSGRRSAFHLSRQRGCRGGTFRQIEGGLPPHDLDKVSFALGNIQNHFDGVGGPDHVTIALVVHGQALRAFHSAAANPDISKRVGQFSKAGLELAACGNTMKSQNVVLKDLLPGFIADERGGVVRIAELQSRGYLYLRP